MRNLTIVRAKRFAACLGRMKVYIEDPDAHDLTMGGVSCRKLGTLKNGEEATFSVTEHEARVFVIADRLSKSYCNDYYVLPAGTQDVVLSGKNSFDPVSGNAFHFDGPVDEQRARHWMRSRNIGAIVLIIAMLVGLAVGVALVGDELQGLFGSRRFGRGNFYITLTDDFSPVQYTTDYAQFQSEDVTVTVSKWPKPGPDIAGYESLEAFADMMLSVNGHHYAMLHEEENFWYYCTYTDEPYDTYHGYFMMYEGAEDFYMVCFSVSWSNHYTQYHDQIMQWANSVSAD